MSSMRDTASSRLRQRPKRHPPAATTRPTPAALGSNASNPDRPDSSGSQDSPPPRLAPNTNTKARAGKRKAEFAALPSEPSEPGTDRPRTRTDQQRKRHKRTTIAAEGSGPQTSDLKPLTLTPSPKTHNINKWLTYKDDVKAGSIAVTSLRVIPRIIMLLDIYDDRRFEVVDVKPLTVHRQAIDPTTGKRQLDKKGNDIVEKVKYWAIHVTDKNKIGAPVLRLHEPFVSSSKQYAARPGAMTLTVCPTEDQARLVAEQACRHLDRILVSLAEFNSSLYKLLYLLVIP